MSKVISLGVSGPMRMDHDSLVVQNRLRMERGQPRLHECCVCGHVAEWGSSWWWYGSVLDEENGKVLKYCTDKCRPYQRDPK